jgi:replicative DNA helicase Mcm
MENFLREYYYKELEQAVQTEPAVLVIDFQILDRYNHKLADKLLEYPEETLKQFNEAVKEIDLSAEGEVTIRVRNLPESRNIRIRDLRAEHLDKLWCIDAVVKSASEVKPQIYEAVFECPECGAHISVEQTGRTLQKASVCDCGRRGDFELIEQKMHDVRMLQGVEPFEITTGEQPGEIVIMMKKDLTVPKLQKKSDPGKRLKVTGILKTLPKWIAGKLSLKMDTYIESVYFENAEIDFDEIEISEEDEQAIKELSRDKKIYDKLIDSIAPGIYGHREIKEAIVMQMFGGIPHTLPDGSKLRENIHILITGDPSVGKSRILSLVTDIVPRAKYASGKGVTGAGLTASVVRNEILGGWILEAGAIVLANKSLMAIDEFDKMNPDDQVAMHEAMSLSSYHPDTMITMADGTCSKISEIVEEYFKKGKIIQGDKCLYVKLKGKSKIMSTDFKRIFEKPIIIASKHIAPDYFYKITLRNNREITVTPDHPCFIFDKKIKEIDAEKLKEGMLAPIVKNSKISYCPIKQIKKIKNKDVKWVYDLTVPGKIFISNGMVLHNTVSIAKASISATLPANTAILAGANPKLGRFDMYKSIAEQIDIPETLLSRFDLKFALKDKPDRVKDEQMAEHMLKARAESNDIKPVIDPLLLRKYLAYAKRIVRMSMVPEAAKLLKDFYVDMRNRYVGDETPTISITLRQYEALIRLAEASAKVRLAKEVTVDDAERAIKLMKFSLSQLGTDFETGRIDIDRVESGITASKRSKLNKITDIIETLTNELGKEVSMEDVLAAAEEQGITNAEEIINSLIDEGIIYQPKSGFVRKV